MARASALGPNRRELLGLAGLTALVGCTTRRSVGRDEAEFDVVVLGAGLGGCAAALTAARRGARVLLTEPTDWIGGQLTSQGVPPDENEWIETAGCTATYRELRNGIRALYRRRYPLSESARANEHLNPGAGWVSRLCCEPRLARVALERMLIQEIARGRITLWYSARPVSAETERDRVRSVGVEVAGERVDVSAELFLDATEEGDLFPLAGVEYVTGSESAAETGEPHAPAESDPRNVQAFTLCFALEHRAGEDHRSGAPPGYATWREFVPALDPPWTGPLIDFVAPHPVTLEPRLYAFDPGEGTGERAGAGTRGLPNLWTYRRIVHRKTLGQLGAGGDVTLVNWPQNDYMLGNLHDGEEHERERALAGARSLGLALVHWLQTEAPRHDGGTGWKGLRLRGDVLGTEDGFAKAPYVRESRRLRAVTTIAEQDVAPAARRFHDTVGVGHYRIDLHPTTGGDNYVDLECSPFEIPLGALLPQRVENVVAAAKNIGTTHITNGAYRLHPVEWNIGEAAGALAARSLREGGPPRAIRAKSARLEAFQAELASLGFQLRW